jgi:hypothetical protein
MSAGRRTLLLCAALCLGVALQGFLAVVPHDHTPRRVSVCPDTGDPHHNPLHIHDGAVGRSTTKCLACSVRTPIVGQPSGDPNGTIVLSVFPAPVHSGTTTEFINSEPPTARCPPELA